MFLYRVVNFKNINFLLLYCKYVHHFIIKHSIACKYCGHIMFSMKILSYNSVELLPLARTPNDPSKYVSRLKAMSKTTMCVGSVNRGYTTDSNLDLVLTTSQP